MKTLHPSILRQYDIRGIVNQTFFPEDAYSLGRAFAQMGVEKLGATPTLVVGWDGRPSSPEFRDHLIAGLREGGANVITIGCGPSPYVYFGTVHLKADGGVVVTASHNPSSYNGLKMTLGGSPFYGEQIQELGRRAAYAPKAAYLGTLRHEEVFEAYAQRLISDLELSPDLKVVWDPGNGAAVPVLEYLLPLLPGTHSVICGTLDGTFPNHHPDPTVEENLAMLKEAVLAQQADLGIAFDGDGDRIGAVDHLGNSVAGDQILCLLTPAVLKKHPGAPIVADVKVSDSFFEWVSDLGGKPIMASCGHSNIKALMKEIGSPLGGEVSGHIFIGDRYYGFDDALYAGLRLLEVLSLAKCSLQELRNRLPKRYASPEIRIPPGPLGRIGVIENVLAYLDQEGIIPDQTDGVRVTYPHGWWGARASNTADEITLRAEGKTEEALVSLLQDLFSILKALNVPI